MVALPTMEYARMALRTALYDRFSRPAVEIGLSLGPIQILNPPEDGRNWAIKVTTRSELQDEANTILASVQRQIPMLATG